jgi:hypothetical protein
VTADSLRSHYCRASGVDGRQIISQSLAVYFQPFFLSLSRVRLCGLHTYERDVRSNSFLPRRLIGTEINYFSPVLHLNGPLMVMMMIMAKTNL